MTYDDFSQLMKTLSSRKNTESIHEITDEEIKEAFRLIDEDHSNTIEFD